ncbi:mycofactocin-coupled SDR family oxidoreductase [Nocardia mikamii]|uniref:mycofactocin-coupled SDR family oxidoreductase n=1 Tax=Nocardia mikamii TaxID=508464 RepID=UPI0007A537F5|nr:mycofactocin-coupled SDR family oxidoreductase [Nocardia mikamii]
MRRVEGKVALVTGAARGQGRSHAVRLAEEGADIIAVDICAPVASCPYPMATEDELAETAELVEKTGRKVFARTTDVRDLAAMRAVVAEGVAQLGGLDIVSAGAGIGSFGWSWELSEETWQELIDINLTGVWKTTTAAIPHLLRRGSGSIVLTSSLAGANAYANLSHYTAAKHGVVGLMKALSVELAPHNIRVNTVNPTNVDTIMINNPATYAAFFPGMENPTREDAQSAFYGMHGLRIGWVDPVDVSNALLWLASDEARYVTGTSVTVDGGASAPFKIPNG